VSWFLVDDNFSGHEKVTALRKLPGGLAAIGLWTLCGSWSRRHRRGGFVPDATVVDYAGETRDTSEDVHGRVRTSSDASEMADLLVRGRLWTRVDGGYQFHDWGEVYRIEDKEAQRKRKDADRKRAERALKRLQEPDEPSKPASMDGPRTPGDGDGTEGSGYSSLEGSNTCARGAARLLRAGGAR
jgi:hypothetical protein